MKPGAPSDRRYRRHGDVQRKPQKDPATTWRRSDADADDGPLLIFGNHAVEAALANPSRVVRKAWFTENAARRFGAALAPRGFAAEEVRPKDLDNRLGPDTVHQGALIEVEDLPELTLAELIGDQARTGPLVLLDQVTDPHNVGAILRSCAAFGARGLVLTRRHSPPLAGALAKAASGALEIVPVALVPNLARSMLELKDEGIRLIGLDGEAETTLEGEALTGDVALVLGAEGKGLRQLTRDNCDALVKITGGDGWGSLNVSNAAAIALHFAAYRRRLDPAG